MFSTRRITTSGGDVFRDEFSVDFTGDNEYILTDFKPNYIHTNATFAMWVKMANFSGSQLMGSHSNKRWYFGFSSLKAFIGVANNNINNITITPTPVAGQWLHYAVTAVDGTATVYINGVAQSTTLSYTQNSGHNPVDGFAIAIRRTSTNADGADTIVANPIQGKISDVVQYDKGLSASEIKTLYNGREPYNHKEGVCSSNLQAWWRMGDSALDDRNGLVADQTNVTISNHLDDTFASDTGYSGTKTITGGQLTKGDTGLVYRDDILTISAGDVIKFTVDTASISGSSLNAYVGGTQKSISSTGVSVIYIYTAASNQYIGFNNGDGSVFNSLKIDKVGAHAGTTENMAANDFEGDTP